MVVVAESRTRFLWAGVAWLPPKGASFSRHSLGRVQCETTNRGGAAAAEMFKVQQWP